MPDPTVVRRVLAPVQNLVAGEWSDETVSGRPAICCPDCGRVSDLPLEQRVGVDGAIEGDWCCPYAGCGHVGLVRLEAWSEEVLR